MRLDQSTIMKPKLQKRLCDYCNEATALLYCRADSAKLCLACDHEVHSTNQLFSKHTRSLLCDVCNESPVAIFCETEHSVFCQNCDWESHSLSLSSTAAHNRRPVEGFSGCPSATELMGILGFEDVGHKKSLFSSDGVMGSDEAVVHGDDDEWSDFGNGYSDLFVWDSPAVVSIDDLIVSSGSGENFQALGVPPLPKNRNAASGQHKEEILCQLRELLNLESDSNCGKAAIEHSNMFQSLDSDLQTPNLDTSCEPDALPAFMENSLDWFTDNGEAANQVFVPPMLLRSNVDESCAAPDKQSDIGGSANHINDGHEAEPQPPITTSALTVFPRAVTHEINSQERESAISRYKEKKRTRRYDKHIRYESRKVRAEARTRIRGRFAKIDP